MKELLDRIERQNKTQMEQVEAIRKLLDGGHKSTGADDDPLCTAACLGLEEACDEKDVWEVVKQMACNP